MRFNKTISYLFINKISLIIKKVKNISRILRNSKVLESSFIIPIN